MSEIAEDYEVSFAVDTLFFLAGAGLGILFLIFWYLVYGPQGFIAASNFGLYIPFTSFQLHHEIFGVFIMAFGAPFVVSDQPPVRALGLIFIGLGGVFFLDDLFQHCFINQLQAGGIYSGGASCSNWP